jgi:hypothetical protein
MQNLQVCAEAYLNGQYTPSDLAVTIAVIVARMSVEDIDTLAFLLSYGEMPQGEA